MRAAIVTGATGLVGRAVAKCLAANGINVLAVGRRLLGPEEVETVFGDPVPYVSMEMQRVQDLPARLESIGWHPGDECVFYHFAWGGALKLTDGSFSEQLSNAIYAPNAVKAAKQLGCTKFVDAGTTEETFIGKHIKEGSPARYESAQTNYGLSKIASRDMCSMVAYLEKIDYVHTRMSVPLDLGLQAGSYVASTLRKIADGKSYEAPLNERFFDFVSLDDVARAFLLIGRSGANKADYIIGTGKPTTLRHFFNSFQRRASGAPEEDPLPVSTDILEQFSIAQLQQDTGFESAGFLEKYFGSPTPTS
jgi:nucleoside-diphosphate-sugar epimerase